MILQDRVNEKSPSTAVRVLFVADTHLGFDLPSKPRIKRRRRGADFFANFRRALEPALKGEVDLVVHGGDLLYRSKVPLWLVNMAFEPLKQVADSGIPVFLVPGNHERSKIPYRLLAVHPNIHIFHNPKTYLLQTGGISLSLAGFPYIREGIRDKFPQILEATGYKENKADCNLLCMHHCVEGASVGPRNFTFRDQDFVIRMADIPGNFTAVLSGHIHRFQVLTKDISGRPAPLPILYPGSIERTSFAEKDEKKGYLSLEILSTGPMKGKLKSWKFHELPARPMVQIEMRPEGMKGVEFKSRLLGVLQKLPEDSVVKIKISGRVEKETLEVLKAAALRTISPPMMNVSVTIMDNQVKNSYK